MGKERNKNALVGLQTEHSGETNNDSVQPSNPAGSARQVVSKDPKYAKYQRMLTFGIPKPAVMQSMAKDGVDPSGLFGNSDPQVSTFNVTKPVRITADALLRTSLKKRPAGTTPVQKPKASRPGVVTLADLQAITLRKATSRSPRLSKKRHDSSGSGCTVTLDDLKRIKLRKIGSHTNHSRVAESAGPNWATGGNNRPGAVLSLEQLQSIKLRKTPSRVSQKGEKENMPMQQQNCNPLLQGMTSIKLRKTELLRSPGGTPKKAKRREGNSSLARGPFQNVSSQHPNRSPSKAVSNAEYLELALQKKFANARPSTFLESPSPERKPGRMSISSAWSPVF